MTNGAYHVLNDVFKQLTTINLNNHDFNPAKFEEKAVGKLETAYNAAKLQDATHFPDKATKKIQKACQVLEVAAAQVTTKTPLYQQIQKRRVAAESLQRCIGAMAKTWVRDRISLIVLGTFAFLYVGNKKSGSS